RLQRPAENRHAGVDCAEPARRLRPAGGAMSDVRIVIDADQAAAAFRKSPEVMLRHAARGTERAAHVIARAAKGKVSKSQSTLANSLSVEQIAGLGEAEVGHQAAPGVAYAPYVEEGTGPAAGRPRYYPNPDALLDFIS